MRPGSSVVAQARSCNQTGRVRHGTLRTAFDFLTNSRARAHSRPRERARLHAACSAAAAAAAPALRAFPIPPSLLPLLDAAVHVFSIHLLRLRAVHRVQLLRLHHLRIEVLRIQL